MNLNEKSYLYRHVVMNDREKENYPQESLAGHFDSMLPIVL